MSIRRRELLRGLGGLAAYACVPWSSGCADEGRDEGAQLRDRPAFLHGVASGDPLPDAVILWTRVTPVDDAPLRVHWELAEDLGFEQIIAHGEARAEAARDFTVKLDATGLSPATTYYYRFSAGEVQSPIGRTRTAPEGSVDELRFAVVSCSSYAHGYFHAYRAVAQRLELDAVIHLGDYIYEYGTGEYGDVRDYEPEHEILTLDDYRLRYAQYRRDPDLRALHQQLPMIAIWDDHEVANNTWLSGAENHNPDRGEGPFTPRKAAALRAYREWMPIRDSEDGRCFRQLQYGDLVDLILLDTRNWGREQQVTKTDAPELQDPKRSLLGADQEQWLAEAMERSTARWRLIGQQVMVGPYPVYWSSDDWNGYPAARDRLLALLDEHAAKDSVLLTGDVHSSFAVDLLRDGDRSVAVELVTPAISSPGWERTQAESLHPMLLQQPHVKYANLWQRGYMLLDVTAERVQAAWYLYDQVEDPTRASESFAAAFATYAGEHRLRPAAEPSLDTAPAPEAAPIEAS